MTSFVHDMFLTQKYAIVIDGSVRSDGARLKLGKGITFFDETKPLRFGVLPRSKASPENVKWVTTGGPGSVWHTISAWDNEDGVNIMAGFQAQPCFQQVQVHVIHGYSLFGLKTTSHGKSDIKYEFLRSYLPCEVDFRPKSEYPWIT